MCHSLHIQPLGTCLDESPQSKVKIQKRRKKKQGNFFPQVFVAHCLLCILATNCLHVGLQNQACDGTCPHLSNLMGFSSPLSILSLPKQLLPFPLFRAGWEKNILPHYQHRESQRKLTSHCQWAEDVFHLSRSTNKRPGVCLGVTRLIFAVNYFFTEVGNRQKHAPIRALKANALLRKGAPALCLPAQGHKRDIPFFKPP